MDGIKLEVANKFFLVLIITCISLGHRNKISTQVIKQTFTHGYNDFIHVDKDNLVWIGSDNGVYIYDGLNLDHKPPGLPEGQHGEIVMSEFFQTNSGDLLFSTDQGINIYNSRNCTFDTLAISHLNDEITNSYYLIEVTEEHIISRIGNDIFQISRSTNEAVNLGPSIGVRYSIIDSTIIGCPWLNGPGLEFIDMNIKSKINILPQFPNLGNSEFSQVIPINKTSAWGLSNQGLFKINPSTRQFVDHINGVDNQNVFTYGEIINDSILLVTNRTTGLWKFDYKKKIFSKEGLEIFNGIYREIYSYSPNLYFKSIDSISVHSTILDKTDAIWCSTKSGILTHISDSSYTITQQTTLGSEENSGLEIIYRQDQNIWAVHNNCVWLNYDTTWENKYCDNYRILDIVHISNNNKIILTSNGVFRINQIENDFKKNKKALADFTASDAYKYFQLTDSTILVPYQEIYALEFLVTEDLFYSINKTHIGESISSAIQLNDKLYIGTPSGLLQVSSDRDSITRLAPPYNTINLANTDQTLWMTSNNMIIKYDIPSDEHLVFDPTILDDELLINRNTILTKNQSEIVLGTNKGLLSFNTEDLSPYRIKPNILLKNISINGKLWKYYLNNDNSNILELPYGTYDLEFEVLSISHYLPEDNKITYVVDGILDKPKSLENGSKLSYLLSSGDYKFQIRSKNSSGISSDPFSFNVLVQPPFWKTTSFFSFIFITGLSLTYFLSKYYYQQRLKKEQYKFEQEIRIQKTLELERNRIATDMHDDLGGGLTSIRSIIYKLQNSDNVNPDNSNLNRVSHLSEDLIKNMRSIVWAMNSQYDNLASMINYLKSYSNTFLEDNDINLDFSSTKIDNDIIVSGLARRNFYLVLKEALNNVVKHSQATKAVIEIRLQQNILEIIINDNGIGMPIEKPAFGNGLNNMKERITRIGGDFSIISSQQGTSITLQYLLDESIAEKLSM